jgi:hypothetical protein
VDWVESGGNAFKLCGYNVPVRVIDLRTEREMGLDLEPGARLYGTYATRTARLLNGNGVETRVVEHDSAPELEMMRESVQWSETEA